MALSLDPQTPIQLAAQQLQDTVNGLQSQMILMATNAFNTVWNNPDQVNCSPDKMVAAIGTNAVALMTANSAIQALVNAVQPGALVLNIPLGWTLTPNQDGSAVASYVAPVS